ITILQSASGASPTSETSLRPVARPAVFYSRYLVECVSLVCPLAGAFGHLTISKERMRMANPLLDNELMNRVPKVISPTTHAVIDYIVVGYYFIAAGACWGGNKRASIAALANGAAVLGVSMFTDYRGDGRKPISFETHGKIDVAQGAAAAAAPFLLGFGDKASASL